MVYPVFFMARHWPTIHKYIHFFQCFIAVKLQNLYLMMPNVSHRVHAQQKIVALGVLLTLRNITIICGSCHKNKCNSTVHQTFWSNIIHQNRWSQRLLACFQGEKKQKKQPSSTPPQMAINFNFLPKTTFYTASLCHSVLASSPLRLKKGEKMQKGADKSDTLHINCTYRRTAPAPPATPHLCYHHNGGIISSKQTSERLLEKRRDVR